MSPGVLRVSLQGHGDGVRSLTTEETQMLHPSSKKSKRTIQRTTALSLLLWSLVKLGSKSLGNISVHLREKVETGKSQPAFTKDKSCLTNMIAFYNKTTTFADNGRVVVVIYVNFTKAFDTVFHFPRSFPTWTVLWSCETRARIARERLSFTACSLSAPSMSRFSLLLGCNREVSDDGSQRTVVGIPHLDTWSQSPGCYKASVCKDYSFTVFHSTKFV